MYISRNYRTTMDSIVSIVNDLNVCIVFHDRYQIMISHGIIDTDYWQSYGYIGSTYRIVDIFCRTSNIIGIISSVLSIA